MIGKISEHRFEDAIECALLGRTPDACDDDGFLVGEPEPSYLGLAPGGYRRRNSQDYDKELCLFRNDVLDFVYATQPKEWGKLKEHHGKDAQAKFLARLSSEISGRGLLDVLRNGVKDSGVLIRLAYFQPASGLNEETFRLYEANMFTVVRQLHYSKQEGPGSPSLDLVLCLNGLPLFTAELKNRLNGQDVQDAIRQYKETRDPREPLFQFKRCLAHFAVDPDLVFVTTRLAKEKTRFLPFNQGRDKGAGNPQLPPSRSGGYPTDYLWNHVWARDSVLELVRQFIQDITEEDEDENGNKVKKNFLLFPRYHQLDTVRRLVRDSRLNGAGKRYLIQHSAGSGKSYTLAWLAHQLSTLHNGEDNRVFDSIIVITDRRILDKQLQNTMQQLEHVVGVVENIDKTSAQLKQALQAGKTIIVTTLQKFPAMLEQIRELAEKKPGQGKHEIAGKRFAVIVDEAHSSQSGETSEAVNRVFASESLEEAAKLEEAPQKDFQDKLVDNAEGRKYPPNMSVFAFTATPKAKTLEHFGVRRPDGQFEAFSLYSMRQAIEEGFIRDVLENYTTYEVYWRLLKRIEDDPRYEKGKATYLLKSFVDLHPHAIREKIAVMVNHFDSQVKHQVGGKAKAMIVTRSRLHAVRYKLALDAYLAEMGLPYKALVAFSGTVDDGGKSYTEAGMNGFPEAQTARTFKKPEYRFLVVAEKFQTGFDQPLLHTMYVDKKLSGLNAVQTLSRLNRTHPEKEGTMVLDFANEAEEIRKAFEVYYEATLLSEGTDPNQLYDLQRELLGYGVFDMSEVMRFAEAYHDPKSGQDKLYALLAPVTARVEAVDEERMAGLRGHFDDFTRLYAFLSQILTFADADLEALYPFAKYLRRLIQGSPEELPREIQQNIDMESYRLQQRGSGNISLKRGNGKLEPVRPKEHPDPGPEEIEPLSRILAELNERFGLNLGPEHKITLGQIMGRLENDFGLDASARVNARENVRLTFEHKIDDAIEDVVDSNFEFYRRIRDDKAFGEALKDFAFEQYLRNHRKAADLVKQQESKTLEFKSTLRWNLKENKQDNIITHAVLKTIAAFLNTDGGDLLIGVADDGAVVGLDLDGFENADKFLLHLTQVVHNALGAHAAKRIDPRTQVVDGKTVCLVACQRGQQPIRLKWKGMETDPEGDYFVRMGPGSKKLTKEEAEADIQTRFGWKTG